MMYKKNIGCERRPIRVNSVKMIFVGELLWCILKCYGLCVNIYKKKLLFCLGRREG